MDFLIECVVRLAADFGQRMTVSKRENLHLDVVGERPAVLAYGETREEAARRVQTPSLQFLGDRISNMASNTARNKPRNCDVFPLFKGLTAALIDNGSLPATMLTAFG